MTAHERAREEVTGSISMSDLDHFLRLSNDARHAGCSHGELAARRLAQALVASWPYLDFAARRGAVDLAMMCSRSASDAADAAGVWYE